MDAKKVGHVLTMNGFMMDGFEAVTYEGKPDYVLSLEVRQNRPDCLGVIGVAREVAAAFNLKVVIPRTKINFRQSKPAVRVAAKQSVKRVVAGRIDGLKNGPSPKWLRDYVEFSGMNSVDLLVDISNYAMLMTGYPNHLFDVAKIHGTLTWSENSKFSKMTTLAGTILELEKKGEMVIHDDERPLATTMVGSKEAEVDARTTSVLAEVATYDPARVRSDSRAYRVSTEASRRLDKDLDQNGVKNAFIFLADLVCRYAGGQMATAIFDYYPKKTTSRAIVFDPAWPSRYSGTLINGSEVEKSLKRLRFEIKKGKSAWRVAPPSDRTDIELAEDVVEEVVRLTGYEKIPWADMPALSLVPDVTPPHIVLAEKIRDELASQGMDEVRLLPVTTESANRSTNYGAWEMIRTQNSINEELPVMRQTILSGLLSQLQEFRRKNVVYTRLFEIGKIFGKIGERKYAEHDACGILVVKEGESSLLELQAVLERVLRSLGYSDLSYEADGNIAPVCNPKSSWHMSVGKTKIGVLAKLKPIKLTGNSGIGNVAWAEFDLEALSKLSKAKRGGSVVELTQKLVFLDTNLELDEISKIHDHLENIRIKLPTEKVWSIEVVDIFLLSGERVRVTVRTTYQNVNEQEAKELNQIWLKSV